MINDEQIDRYMSICEATSEYEGTILSNLSNVEDLLENVYNTILNTTKYDQNYKNEHYADMLLRILNSNRKHRILLVALIFSMGYCDFESTQEREDAICAVQRLLRDLRDD